MNESHISYIAPIHFQGWDRHWHCLKEVLVNKWMRHLRFLSSHPLLLLPPTPSPGGFLSSHTLTRCSHSETQRGGCTHTHTNTWERHGKTTSSLCDDISVFGRNSSTAAALLGWVSVCVRERDRDWLQCGNLLCVNVWNETDLVRDKKF